jgi:tRNA A37 methylthiotransferase MiaB
LDKVLKKGVEENNKKLIGTKQKVLITRTKVKNIEGLFGRTEQGKDVLIDNIVIPAKAGISSNKVETQSIEVEQPSRSVGEFVNVEITGIKGFRLEGKMV